MSRSGGRTPRRGPFVKCSLPCRLSPAPLRHHRSTFPRDPSVCLFLPNPIPVTCSRVIGIWPVSVSNDGLHERAQPLRSTYQAIVGFLTSGYAASEQAFAVLFPRYVCGELWPPFPPYYRVFCRTFALKLCSDATNSNLPRFWQ